MKFNRKNKRFNSRFSSSVNRYPSKKNSNLTGMIQQHYSTYIEKLQLGKRNPVERIVLVGLSAFTAAMLLGLLTTAAISITLPSTKNADSLLKNESTVFFDRTGKVLYTVHGEENREVVESNEIPNVVKQAAVAIEDDRFFKHGGFDLPGIIKAVLSELGIGARRGGSTITQQFVKNAMLSRERTYTRKLKEIILATRIERHYTKDEILTMYLNKIPYGGTAYGVQKGSEVFFAKKASELKLEEAVILAALPQAPTYFSPFSNNKYSTLNKEFTLEELGDRKIKSVRDLKDNEYNFGLIGKYYPLIDGSSIYLPGRTDEVLRRMFELDYISEDERAEALTKVQNYEFNDYVATIKAPHFVFYIKELLEKEYGKELVENGGLRVYTTLDYELYEESRKIVSAQAATNKNSYKAMNAAAITVNPSNGEILSMVGSADYNDQEIDGSVNITTSSRQPGSSFKPIVYAAAFAKNVGPGTVLYDVPTKLDNDTPKNYDGSFRGPMTVRQALGQSRNIPAIKAYYLAGEQDAIINFSEMLGITTLDRRVDYGWPLSLGAGEVRMIEMAEAFGAFANGGEKVAINGILKVLDSDGKVLQDFTKTVPKKTKAVDSQIAYLINNILSDSAIKLSGQMNLPEGRVVATKTGTSTKRVGDTSFPSNLWAVGYTPQLVTITWAGNSDGTEMTLNADGTSGAIPMWNKIMTYASKGMPKVNFEKPTGITSVTVSKLSGKLAGENTPENFRINDIFASFNVPKEVDNSFYKAKVDTRNNKIPNSFCPEDVVKELTFYNPQAEIQGRFNMQAEIISWFQGLAPEAVAALQLGANVVIGAPIMEDSELCNPELANKFLDITIFDLENGMIIPKGAFSVETSPEAEAGVERVEFFINDLLFETKSAAPYNANLVVPVGYQTGKEFSVRVKVYDKNGFSKEKKVDVVTGEPAGAGDSSGLATEEVVAS
jgi:membrane peptidoglycan carboxypeptidase